MIVELERLACLGRGPSGGGRLLLMLEAYFDESYDTGQRQYYAMAGLVGSREAWSCLWGEWDRTLVRHGLTIFHAVDCANGYAHFADRSATEREAIYGDFLGIILKARLVGHASMIPLKLYRGTFPDYRHGSEQDPYFMAFRDCVESVCLDNGIASLPQDEKIAFVFDQNPEVMALATDLYGYLMEEPARPYHSRLERVCQFSDKATIKPLQAADVMAYEYFRALKDREDGKPARQEYVALSARFGQGWVVIPAPPESSA